MHLPSNRLLRQLLGAAAGSVVALVLYQAYELVSPALTAMLPERGAAAEQYTDESRAEKQAEIVDNARTILNELLQEESRVE